MPVLDRGVPILKSPKYRKRVKIDMKEETCHCAALSGNLHTSPPQHIDHLTRKSVSTRIRLRPTQNGTLRHM